MLYNQIYLLVLISVRSLGKPKAMMRLGGLGELKNPKTSSGSEPAILKLTAWYLKVSIGPTGVRYSLCGPVFTKIADPAHLLLQLS
jgi:hypothetical protein